MTPELGLDRKKDIESRMKKLQNIDEKIRYQIRLAEDDFKVFLKFYTKGEYKVYREMPLEYLDPNDEVRSLKPLTTNDEDDEDVNTPDEHQNNFNNWNNVLSIHT